MPAARALVVTLVSLALLRAAHAQDAAPRGPRVVHVPTAWVLGRDTAWGRAGVDHRGTAMVDLTVALGGLAELDAGLDDTIATCACRDGRALSPASLAMAGFKLGIARGRRGRALGGALGFRRSFAAPTAVAALYAAASAELRGLRVHAGVMAWDAREAEVTRATAPHLRPFAALEWTPAPYPRTTLVGDLSWLPELDGNRVTLRWIAGWGVRYQALAWGSIELAVRHRGGDDLGGSTVLVRVNGRLGR
ncbi:MAG: hypothetical protein K8W52_21555 [Deltaproteobacteria bacterium]|nr:hypothetical protein [Deltaproteobacteria bacterium]